VVKWLSKWCTSDPVVIVFGVHFCHVPEEMTPAALNKTINWRTSGSVPDDIMYQRINSVQSLNDVCTYTPSELVVTKQVSK